MTKKLIYKIIGIKFDHNRHKKKKQKNKKQNKKNNRHNNYAKVFLVGNHELTESTC